MFSKQEQLSKVREPKPKYRRKCKTCRIWFRTDSETQKVCGSIECALSYVKKENEKKHRQEKRAFKGSDKSHQRKIAQQIFNKFIRIRDEKLPCISCNTPKAKWDAGHYFAVGSGNSCLRFNVWNVHKQCYRCNQELSANKDGYTPNLKKKIGLERFERLEENRHGSSKHHTLEYYKRITVIFRKKIKRIENKSL